MKRTLACLLTGLALMVSTAHADDAAPAKKYPAYLDGAVVPMVTPYKGENAENLDLDALSRLTDYLCQTSAAALFPVSGTGQWSRLTLDEKKKIITTCLKAAKKRKPVLGGVGSVNNSDEVIELARFAEKAGVDGIVVVTPSFIRDLQTPDKDGVRRITDQKILEDYFTQICAAVKSPVLLYDPESELEAVTVGRLIETCPTIVGIKARERNKIEKFQDLAIAIKGRIALLSGSERVALAAIRHGATGMIGNGLNIYPDLGQSLVEACRAGKWEEAAKMNGVILEANQLAEHMGGGAQGIKKILNEVIGVKMNVVNRGDTFKPEPQPGQHKMILTYFEKMNLPKYRPGRAK